MSDNKENNWHGNIVIRNYDGLNIITRQNIWDEIILREKFIEKQYDISISDGINIRNGIDIGGYIGDFSLYAIKYMNVEKVIVCEPMIENFRILRQNVENNEQHR